jgi:5,6-dimethylbenzimidazole synthase
MSLASPSTAERRPPVFDPEFRARLLELFAWRRDVRRFRPDPVAPAKLEALFDLAALAPSVGLSQPWRFVLVDDPIRRAAVRRHFERTNRAALAAQAPDRASRYAELKLEGLDAAPVQFAVYCEPEPAQGHGLGRMSMPETTAYSAVMALHTLWLGARAEDLGLGWVSIVEPAAMAEVLDVPAHWTLIGYFCLGHPAAESEVPELERLGWETRRAATVLRR